MSSNKLEVGQSVCERVVISRLDVKKISALIFGSITFIIGGFVFKDIFRDSTTLYLFGLRMSATWLLGQIFFFSCAAMFSSLLIRRLFSDAAAIYIQNGYILYFNPFRYIRVEISKIKQIGLSPYPNFVCIEMKSGILKYIPAAFTDLSAIKTVDKLIEEVGKLNIT